jgi:hypothetical protein
VWVYLHIGAIGGYAENTSLSAGRIHADADVVWADDSGVFADDEVGFDTGGPYLLGYGTFFRGLLADYEIGDDAVTLNLVSWNVLWRKKTLRIAQAGCPWPFKGTECAYAGAETWCDQSYDRCEYLENEDNFGGDPFLPSLEEAQIYWGRSKNKA